MTNKYACSECGWTGTEDEMGSDYLTPNDDFTEEIWSNWICPDCSYWHPDLDEYLLLEVVRAAWNAKADEYNQWESLSDNEKREFIMQLGEDQ